MLALECIHCNRTYYGLTDLKYPLRLSERRSPTCTLTFIAAGGRYGDRIEITFLSFQIGTFDLDSRKKKAANEKTISITHY
ncbi:UNVERIFIED_CONTAM: hypothetical protein NCL1_23698 [Trichonephila clavipes]